MQTGRTTCHQHIGRQHRQAVRYPGQRQGTQQAWLRRLLHVDDLQNTRDVTQQCQALPQHDLDGGLMMIAGHHVWRCWRTNIDHHQAAALPIVGQVGEGAVHHHIDNAAKAV